MCAAGMVAFLLSVGVAGQASAGKIPQSDVEYKAHMTEVETLLKQGGDLLGSNRANDAIIPLKKALAICDAYLGEGPYTVLTLEDLGISYATSGDFASAEASDKRALTIADRIYDDTNEHKIDAVANLGVLYNHLGRYKEAEHLLARALALSEKARGASNGRTVFLRQNLSELYKKTGRAADAKRLNAGSAQN